MLLPGPLHQEMILLFEKGKDGVADLDRPYLHDGETVLLFSSEGAIRHFHAGERSRSIVPCQIGDSEGFLILLASLHDLMVDCGARSVVINPRDGVVSRWDIADVLDYLRTIICGSSTIPELN